MIRDFLFKWKVWVPRVRNLSTMSQNQRCFVGIEFSEEVKQQIAQIQTSARNLNVIDGNWEAPHKFHLTLRFLGDISQEQIEILKNRLSNLTTPSFSCLISNKIGHFTGAQPPIRVLWLHLDGMKDLQREVDQLIGTTEPFSVKGRELERIVNQNHEFHVTLLRVKKMLKGKSLCLKELNNLSTEASNIEQPVKYVSLFRSDLKTGQYDVLERFSLP